MGQVLDCACTLKLLMRRIRIRTYGGGRDRKLKFSSYSIHENIAEIYFEGYRDEEEELFQEQYWLKMKDSHYPRFKIENQSSEMIK